MSMICPSDYRFGDSSDPSSPFYEGGDELKSIAIPFYCQDENEIHRRVTINVEYDLKYDGDDGYDIVDAVIKDVELNGSTISSKDAYLAFGDMPDGRELIELIHEAKSWEHFARVDLGMSDANGDPIHAKLEVHYRACPSDPTSNSDKAEIDNVSIGTMVEIGQYKGVSIAKFIESHPGFEMPKGERLVELASNHHEETVRLQKAAPKKNSLRL